MEVEGNDKKKKFTISIPFQPSLKKEDVPLFQTELIFISCKLQGYTQDRSLFALG